VSEFYAGQQFVGMDLHRRRSVLVRMSETGEHLETTRILNDRDVPAEVMSLAGKSPEMVFEATYGEAVFVSGVKTINATPSIWRICCGWAICGTRGSRRRQRENCASWCGISAGAPT
jgi:hypothetical protein